MLLLNNVTATGAWATWGGGDGVFSIVCAGWNAANATLQKLGPDGTTPLPVDTAASFSANGNIGVTLEPCQVRVAITGAVPAAGVYARLEKVRRP